MRKGVSPSKLLAWIVCILILLVILAIYITGTHEIFVKRILDTIDIIIKIREVGS